MLFYRIAVEYKNTFLPKKEKASFVLCFARINGYNNYKD
jgi:hypothetical protein